MKTIENTSNFGSQNGKAKLKIVSQIARVVRKSGLDYDGWRYVSKKVRQVCDLRPAKKGRRLPRVLTAEEFRRFYLIVDRAEDVQHALMLRLLFYTGVRGQELCRIEVADVDLENCKIFCQPGQRKQGSVVLFGKTFATALRTHIAAHHNRWLISDETSNEVFHTPSRADRQEVCRGGWR